MPVEEALMGGKKMWFNRYTVRLDERYNAFLGRLVLSPFMLSRLILQYLHTVWPEVEQIHLKDDDIKVLFPSRAHLSASGHCRRFFHLFT